MKKALIVGVDHYDSPNELGGCVNDATELSLMLETNGDGSPNFEVKRLISSETNITSKVLNEAINELFKGEAETVLFYFAGHGLLDDTTNNGYLVTMDGQSPHWGIELGTILNHANKAYPKIRSTVILLDSCQSGFTGEVPALGNGNVSVIGTGVTILTACHKIQTAGEVNGHGKFTDVLLDALAGAGSDILGRVTPAATYAHVDQTLGAWEQRPIYKANVQNFVTLREVSPRVPKNVLRRLPNYFPTPSSFFQLDPSFEPDRGEEAEALKDVPVDPKNVEIYRELQQCNRHGLVVPVDHEHMWHSAVYSGRCRLTATGAFFRRLAESKKI